MAYVGNQPSDVTVTGSNAIFKERPIWSSGTFVAPVSAMYLVTAIGPGGSGAYAPTGNGRAATGGGAGGLAQKKVRLNAGDTLTITIGAGGAAPTVAGTNGNDGGDTTITGTGVSLIGRGGKGGKTRAVGVGVAAGADGGIGEGGDFNWTGGGSGSATITAATASSVALTGGGAAAVKGVGYSSGNASSGFSNALTGGAGVGGQSGNATSNSQQAISDGASAVKPSASRVDVSTYLTDTSDPKRAHSANGVVGPAYQFRMLEPNGGGDNSEGSSGGVGFSGCGSQVMTGLYQHSAGLFAGGGARNAGTGSTGYRNYAGICGGSGAAVDDKPDAGGDGFAIIEWFEVID